MADGYGEQIHRCFNCGYCKFTSDYSDFNCPSYLRFQLDTYSTSGRLWLIRGWLGGEVEWSEHLEEILYSCVLCKNCVQQCPMRFSTDIVDWIIGARSDMMEKEKGRVPPAVASFLEDTYRLGNPLKAREPRGAWANGVKRYQAGDEYLLYVGCLGSYDVYGQEVARSLVDILKKAQVSFGILGDEEGCCGNEVYNLGETTLFQALAEKNIQKFNQLGVKKIVTLSPHSYNSIKNLYPKFGVNFEVQHYSRFLRHLIEKKAIRLSEKKLRVTYHDPCYLGRYNNVYDDPREVLQSIPGVALIEMPRNRENALCCGGGGGNFVMDLLRGSPESSNRIRIREAYGTGAETIAVACPSCMTMLMDAAKVEGLDEKLAVKDLSQILRQAISG